MTRLSAAYGLFWVLRSSFSILEVSLWLVAHAHSSLKVLSFHHIPYSVVPPCYLFLLLEPKRTGAHLDSHLTHCAPLSPIAESQNLGLWLHLTSCLSHSPTITAGSLPHLIRTINVRSAKSVVVFFSKHVDPI